MKLRATFQNFHRNIFRSKSHLSVAPMNAQLTHSKTWSDFMEQLFCILKQPFVPQIIQVATMNLKSCVF